MREGAVTEQWGHHDVSSDGGKPCAGEQQRRRSGQVGASSRPGGRRGPVVKEAPRGGGPSLHCSWPGAGRELNREISAERQPRGEPIGSRLWEVGG